jgi:hypothetical protein
MAAEDWLPTVDQVAALVRARTRDDAGTELGTFTEDTRPTAAQVADLIASEAPLVAMRTGNLMTLECPDAPSIRQAAGSIVAKRVAAIIEASYRPDELADGRTVADFYQGSLDADLEAVENAARTCRAYVPGDAGGDITGESGPAPRWYFPPAEPMPRGL